MTLSGTLSEHMLAPLSWHWLSLGSLATAPQHVCRPTAELLPLDVWLLVFWFLPVKDLVALSGTSRNMRSMTNERSAWHSALARLLECKPLPCVEDQMPLMSTAELRDAAIRVTRIHTTFSKRHHTARLLEETKIKRAEQAEILPGGERYIAMAYDGDLTIHSFADAQAPLDVVSSPDPRPAMSHFRIAHRSLGQSVVLQFLQWLENEEDLAIDGILRVFLLDSALHLVRTVHTPRSMPVLSYCVDRQHFAYAWRHPSETCVVSIQNIPHKLDVGGNVGATVRLSGILSNGRIPRIALSLAGSRHLILATRSSVFFFKLPPLVDQVANTDEYDAAPAISPVWSTRLHKKMVVSSKVPTIGPTSISGGRARFGICSGYYLHVVEASLSGQAESEWRISSFKVNSNVVSEHALFLGYSYGIQPHYSNQPFYRPFSFSFSQEHGGETGHVPTSEDMVSKLDVHVDGLNKLPARQLSIDEVSGRIGVLYTSTSYPERDSVLRTFSTYE